MRQGFVDITFRKTCTKSKKEIPLRSKQGLSRGRDRAGYLRQQIRKGAKVATSPTMGDGRGRYINKASSEAATGPGICVSKYGKAQRSPLPPQWGTGGGDILTRPHQRPRPGRVFASANTERRKGRHFPHKGDGRGKYIEIWCNGSTTDFGSVCPSSNLGISTTKARHPPGFFASDTKRLYKVKNSRINATTKGRNYQDRNTIYKPRIIIITKAMQIT